MKKYIFVVAVLVVLGIAYWLISPLFINKQVNENLEYITTNTTPAETLAEGSFTGLEGHSAQGTTKLIKIGDRYYIRFDDDFQVTNGPDLFVYFGKNGQYDGTTNIGALKGNLGSQNYEVPTNINPLDYNEVWVWCRSFSVAFGKAVLQ